MRRDPYDVCVAFDDLYAHPAPVASLVVSGADVARATRSVLRRARNKRLAVPQKIEPVAADTTAESFQVDDRNYAVLGADPFADDVEVAEFPVYAAVLRRFQAAQPVTKLLRFDTPSSYARFREDRCVACAGLDARVRALESLVAQHVSDQHGGGRLTALEAAFRRHLDRHPDDAFEFGDYPSRDVLGAELERVARLCAGGGTLIPVVPALRGKVECWQDGEEICCTVRFLDRHGDLSLATTASPIQRHLEEALSSATPAEFEHVLPVLDRLAQVLGSTALIPELCRAAQILSTTGATSPMIVVMSAQSIPTLAAAMALLQRCQQGDPRARAEACAMRDCGGDRLLAEAGNRLVRAQRVKARAVAGAW